MVETTAELIPIHKMLIAFIPVFLVLGIMMKWSMDAKNALYSIVRMLLQLIMVGYVLVFIFASENIWITIAILIVMITASSWIALRTIPHQRKNLFLNTVLASALGGGSILLLVIWPVLELTPIYKPQFTIPLAGMIFANSMNTISLALERLESELKNNINYLKARSIALHTSLIPTINSMFAVGLVSLPGMMTGQVISGVSPLIAVRYQVIVMCMIFAASALSTVGLLIMSREHFENVKNSNTAQG